MSRARTIRYKLSPWAGLIGAALGGGIAHQVGSDTNFFDCSSTTPGVMLLAGLAGLLIVGAGAFLSWKPWGDTGEGQTRRFIAAISLMTAALMVFAILMPMIASLVIPPCHA